jgi:hypothetical protein
MAPLTNTEIELMLRSLCGDKCKLKTDLKDSKFKLYLSKEGSDYMFIEELDFNGESSVILKRKCLLNMLSFIAKELVYKSIDELFYEYANQA